METPHPKARQPRIRIGRVAIATVGIAGTVAIASWFYHPVMVGLHGGVWCVQTNPDGSMQQLYGDACSPAL